MNTTSRNQGGRKGDGDRWNTGRRLGDPFFFAGAMGMFMPSAAPGAGFMAVSSRDRKRKA